MRKLINMMYLRRIKLSCAAAAALASSMVLVACSAVDSQAVFTSAAPRNTDTLAAPPGLTAPDLTTNYKMAPISKGSGAYQVSNVQGMHILSGGSQRWLLIESQNVNLLWPQVLAFLNQIGLSVKYQNPALGVIQSDWASRNNKVPQGDGLRGIFSWVGFDGMYSLNSMYMYRVTLWQNGKDVILMATNYQMDEEYQGCSSPGIANTSSLASSEQQQTKWISRAANPQLELEFLTHFMTFTGLAEAQVAKEISKVESQNAHMINSQVVLNDQLARAWWRTAIALERIGLAVVDKNRTRNEYYVAPMAASVNNPDPGFISGWFAKSESTTALRPVYTVKLRAQDNDTIINLNLFDEHVVDKNFSANQQKYLSGLTKELQ